MSGASIHVTADFYKIRVMIDGLLHVHVPRDGLAVHSWTDHFASYRIEFVWRGGSMLTEYDERDQWAQVLEGLEDVL